MAPEKRLPSSPSIHRRGRRPHSNVEVKPWHKSNEVIQGSNPVPEKDDIIPVGFTGKVVWTRNGYSKVVIITKELGVDADKKRVLQITDARGELIEGGAKREDLDLYIIAKPGKSEPKALDPSDPRYRSYSFEDEE
jgi:hypothetical protein